MSHRHAPPSDPSLARLREICLALPGATEVLA